MEHTNRDFMPLKNEAELQLSVDAHHFETSPAAPLANFISASDNDNDNEVLLSTEKRESKAREFAEDLGLTWESLSKDAQNRAMRLMSPDFLGHQPRRKRAAASRTLPKWSKQHSAKNLMHSAISRD